MCNFYESTHADKNIAMHPVNMQLLSHIKSEEHVSDYVHSTASLYYANSEYNLQPWPEGIVGQRAVSPPRAASGWQCGALSAAHTPPVPLPPIWHCHSDTCW